jgi:hypothetical protein
MFSPAPLGKRSNSLSQTKGRLGSKQKEDWDPDINEVRGEFRARVNVFLKKVGSQFHRKHAPSNLTRNQEHLLKAL